MNNTSRSQAVEFSEKFGQEPGKVYHQRRPAMFRSKSVVVYRVDTNIAGFSWSAGEEEPKRIENMIVDYFETRGWTITEIQRDKDDDLMIEAVGHGVEATVFVANFDGYVMSDWDNDTNHPDLQTRAYFQEV